MCTTKVPVLVKARVREKYMLVGKIAPANEINQFRSTSSGPGTGQNLI
jgi:hypothetical protein